jgi:hypothetical protein
VQPAVTDDVIDLIASIEMHRQELEREAGMEASRSYAVKRLQEALLSEQVAESREALALALKRVQALGSRTSQPPTRRASQPAPPEKSWRDAQGRSPRTRGRRTMGRGSGR